MDETSLYFVSALAVTAAEAKQDALKMDYLLDYR